MPKFKIIPVNLKDRFFTATLGGCFIGGMLFFITGEAEAFFFGFVGIFSFMMMLEIIMLSAGFIVLAPLAALEAIFRFIVSIFKRN